VALSHVPAPRGSFPLWGSYRELALAARAVGLSGIQVTPEWTRLASRPGRYDTTVIDSYREQFRAISDEGLTVHLRVLDEVWPSFLGIEGWLWPWAHDAFVEHVSVLAENFADLASSWVLAPDFDTLRRGGFIDGDRPPFRRGAARDAHEVSEMWAQTVEECSRVLPFADHPVIPVSARTTDVVASLQSREVLYIDALVSDGRRKGLCDVRESGVVVRHVLG
jgi:beta-glucosidase/6-phospho-beta-glucosidase/beta-galactosidase